MISALIFFLGMFGLYLHTCAPHLAPYRDAGEMASLLSTFGVAHPPGYPLYTLIGRLAVWVPLGNVVYRANVFSAFFAAGAVVLLFLVFKRWVGKLPALAGALFFAFSNPFWELANVSEMYALGVFWFALLLYAVFVLENISLFAFLMALGLGVRMDMLLLMPIFILWFVSHKPAREWKWSGLFFAAGASVFLYLLIRSRTDPLIDWGNPDTLGAVFDSASRKSYGGTLDLLSLMYKKGENFSINLALYGRHITGVFGWWGAVASIAGAVAAYKKNWRVALFLSTVFLVTGPIFLFLANMPPNPHAAAIVEASYVIPDLMVAAFIGWGLDLILIAGKGPMVFAAATVVLSALLGVNAATGYPRASKRDNLYARDFVINVFRSLPAHSIAVFAKDVELFSLWEAQLVENRRPDVTLVSKGLSGSPWYLEMHRRWKTAAGPEISLRDDDGFVRLIAARAGRPLVVGYDVTLNSLTGLHIRPQGMGMSFSDRDEPVSEMTVRLLPTFCIYRGRYTYGETADFFSTDLIGDTARAHHQQGFYAMMHNQPEAAEWFFQRAEALDPTFALPTSDRAYMRFSKRDFNGAYALYRDAQRKTEKTYRLAQLYKALPDVMRGCRTDLSNAYTQLGAAAEHLGRLEEARAYYNLALSTEENAQAHYNLAVTYWGRDWTQVTMHLRRAVALNPGMTEARTYLAKAEAITHGQ